MVFKRRNPRGYGAWARELIYPSGGFRRATQYVIHRMRRLPDEPHRIARGIFAGTFINFPPIFGIQMVSAALLAWAMRGNILAAVLSTFMSNPLTTPLIALGSLELGHWMLGIEAPLDMRTIGLAFANAGGELWHNFRAIFTPETARWGDLVAFFWTIYLPYFVGSIIPGLFFSALFYRLSIPLVYAYQNMRAGKARERTEKRKRLKQALADAAARLKSGKDSGDDDSPGSP